MDNSFSSQVRYDHFDTAPGLSRKSTLGKWRELMKRTAKNIQLSRLEKPNKTKDFSRGGCRMDNSFSSQVRYDHFDTAPYADEHSFIIIH